MIACFTGGSSALASLPPDGVSATEKRALHELLLSSGIGIVEVNTVRKHVSAFKGGRLAEAALPARLVNLTVSDVAGDHIDAITDPTVPDSTRTGDAIAVLRGHGLWERTPASIRAHLQGRDAESPELDPDAIQTVLLVTGTTACDAMAVEATELGLTPGGDLHQPRGRGAPGRQGARQPRPPQRDRRRPVRARHGDARLRR